MVLPEDKSGFKVDANRPSLLGGILLVNLRLQYVQIIQLPISFIKRSVKEILCKLCVELHEP